MQRIVTGNKDSYGASAPIVLDTAAKVNPRGKFHYLRDRIYLVRDKPISNYVVFPGVGAADQPMKLSIEDAELSEELERLVGAVNKGRKAGECFKFKPFTGTRQCIKMSSACKVPPPPANHEIRYVITVYAVFQQAAAAGTAHLQMEISELEFKPISLLSQTPWPGSTNDDASSTYATWGSPDETRW